MARFFNGLLLATEFVELAAIADLEASQLEKLLLRSGLGGAEARCREFGIVDREFVFEDLERFWSVRESANGRADTLPVRRAGIQLVTDCLVSRHFLSDQIGISATPVANRPWAEEYRHFGAPRRPTISQRLWSVARGDTDDLGDSEEVTGPRSSYYIKALRSWDTKGRFRRADKLRSSKSSQRTSQSHTQDHKVVPSKPKGERLAAKLEKKLWGGFSRSAIRDLEKLSRSREVGKEDQAAASWALARWHAYERRFDRALDALVLARTANASRANRITLIYLEAECLLGLGQVDEARILIQNALDSQGDNSSELLLALANTYAADGGDPSQHLQLSCINRVFSAHNFSEIRKAEEGLPLSIGNIAGSENLSYRDDGPKVSVIMPVYNASETVETALNSVLHQSWRNLEVIVVDDNSNDDTHHVLETIASRDERVIVLRHAHNQGAYPARNTALRAVSGDFITVHDGDDWSHPQKIETEVTYLERNPTSAAVFLSWTRVLPSLRVTGSWRPGGEIITTDLSSLLFRKEVHEKLGDWDRVKVGGDTEFVWRIQSAYGPGSVVGLHQMVPLSFALHQETSLTRRGPTHARTIFYGVRREYRETVEWWHRRSLDTADLKMVPGTSGRRFPVPRLIDPDADGPAKLDFVFIMDFNIGGGAYVSTMNYVHAALAAGKSVGVFHWRRYDLDPSKPLNEEVRELAAAGKIEVLVAGDVVEADTIIVGYPVILKHMIDRPPRISYRHLLVIINQMASRLFSGGDVQYNPLDLRANLAEAFGAEGTWVPISGLVRDLMLKDSRYPKPHFDIWNPLINAAVYRGRLLSWRGSDNAQPVVGRHCRDHYTKWPTAAADILDAYCADRPCSVRLLGGAEAAFQLIGEKPSNWVVHEFNSLSAPEFLAELDFFVHYPHDDYIEEFGRAVIEAMASGVPVILPPVFEQTFGPAALYASAREVWGVVKRLWSDKDRYFERVHAGRNFVLAQSGYEKFAERLKRLDEAAARVDEGAAAA
ncbi:glycosyltransferase [Enterovirga sp. CN4-39]|uniref:glycosyltransferase n=1 Tax=Enterovirga sp. CN4-39 TaxID=3400910 RepID=UPI003C0DF100